MNVTRSAELELRAVLDAAVDAVVIIDDEGLIESFSRAAEELFGYSAAEVIGRNVSLLMPEPYRSAHDGYIDNYQRTGQRKVIGIGREVVAQRHDGSRFPISLSVGQIQSLPRPRYVGFIHDISARVAQTEALRQARDQAQSYLDLAGVMLLALDAEGRIALINRKGAEILGWPEEELVGRDWFSACVPEEMQQEVRRNFVDSQSGIRSGGATATHEIISRQGQRRLIAWRNVMLRDAQGKSSGTLSSGEDITEQHAAQVALHKSERLLRQAHALAGLANFESRLPSGDAYWSDEMFRMVARDPALGPPTLAEFTDRYVDAGDRDRFTRKWQDVELQGGSIDLEYRLIPESGPTKVVHSLAQAILEADGSLRVSGMLHDITERHRIADEMRQAQERLTQFARLSTMGEMAAGLAHEINQPLTAITTFSQALTRLMARPGGADPGDVSDALEQIAAQALRAGEIIRRLRDFVKNREVHQETLDIRQLVEETLTFAEPDARLSNTRIRLEFTPNLPPVTCDRVHIQQVLLNLVRNAIDATNEANPALREIELIACLTPAGEIEISVSDHGPGISPLVAESLGHPFFTTKATGTGLGIAISRSILRAHGGQFGHRPTPEGGATVFFTLPTETAGIP